MRKARNHLIAAIEFLEADDIVNGAAQIDAAIADLRKVRKKKSRVRTLIEELENLGL